jgi:hypothetical protein
MSMQHAFLTIKPCTYHADNTSSGKHVCSAHAHVLAMCLQCELLDQGVSEALEHTLPLSGRRPGGQASGARMPPAPQTSMSSSSWQYLQVHASHPCALLCITIAAGLYPQDGAAADTAALRCAEREGARVLTNSRLIGAQVLCAMQQRACYLGIACILCVSRQRIPGLGQQRRVAGGCQHLQRRAIRSARTGLHDLPHLSMYFIASMQSMPIAPA